MNLAIRQTSRMVPNQTNSLGQRHRSSGAGSLDRMTKAFGLDISSFGEQAESMWTMLNNLHESDPESYDSFIQQQLKEMNESVNRENTIIPNKGFVVKAFLVNELDSSKKGRESRSKQTKKLFVNFCHHEAVEVPIDTNGEKVTDETQILTDVEIPMVTSKLRDFKDSSGHDAHAVDIVLNPWCLKRSSSSSFFKTQLIQLGLKSVEGERKISMQTNWKLIKSTYKGGMGRNGVNVHPFPIDENMLKQKNDYSSEEVGESKNPESVSSIMNDPQSLLHSLRNCDNDDTQDDFQCFENEKKRVNSKKVLIEEIETKIKPRAKLIEEIDNSNFNSTQTNPSNISEKAEVPLSEQMKGFLNKKKNKRNVIYQKPSTGDGLNGTGGIYSKFMSKCQVIDTANISEISKTEPSSTAKRTFVDGMKKGFLTGKNGCFVNKTSERGYFDAEFDSIMKRADPNFERVFNDRFEEVSNAKEVEDAFRGLVDGVQGHQGKNNARKCVDLPLKPEHETERGGRFHNLDSKDTEKKIPFHTSTDKGLFSVQLHLDGTKVVSIEDINVEICENELNVSTSCGRHLKFVHDSINDEVKARFKRKTKLLSLCFISKN